MQNSTHRMQEQLDDNKRAIEDLRSVLLSLRKDVQNTKNPEQKQTSTKTEQSLKLVSQLTTAHR